MDDGEPKHLASGVEVILPEVDYLDIDQSMVERIKFHMSAWNRTLKLSS